MIKLRLQYYHPRGQWVNSTQLTRPWNAVILTMLTMSRTGQGPQSLVTSLSPFWPFSPSPFHMKLPISDLAVLVQYFTVAGKRRNISGNTRWQQLKQSQLQQCCMIHSLSNTHLPLRGFCFESIIKWCLMMVILFCRPQPPEVVINRRQCRDWWKNVFKYDANMKLWIIKIDLTHHSLTIWFNLTCFTNKSPYIIYAVWIVWKARPLVLWKSWHQRQYRHRQFHVPIDFVIHLLSDRSRAWQRIVKQSMNTNAVWCLTREKPLWIDK